MTALLAGPGLLVGVVRGKGAGIVGGSRNRPINSWPDRADAPSHCGPGVNLLFFTKLF